LSAKDFGQPDNFFRMGTPPVMVDIEHRIWLTSMLYAKARLIKSSEKGVRSG
jgi:hypothetical protein